MSSGDQVSSFGATNSSLYEHDHLQNAFNGEAMDLNSQASFYPAMMSSAHASQGAQPGNAYNDQAYVPAAPFDSVLGGHAEGIDQMSIEPDFLDFEHLELEPLKFDPLNFGDFDFNQEQLEIDQNPSIPAQPVDLGAGGPENGNGQMASEPTLLQLQYIQGNEQFGQSHLADVKRALKQSSLLITGGSYSSHCSSEADFKAKFDAYLTLCDQQDAPKTLTDFPPDNEGQRRLVNQLISAMLYLGDECVDRDSKTPVNRIKKLAALEIDFMAWAILLECREVQQGKLSMPRWGTDWELEHFDSFQARFNSVKAALYRRKSMVASCFDHVFSKRLTANPTKEERQKSSNKAVNAKRADDLDFANVMKAQQPQLAAAHSQRASAKRAGGRAGGRSTTKAKYRAQSGRQQSASSYQGGSTVAAAQYQAPTPAASTASGLSPEDIFNTPYTPGFDMTHGNLGYSQHTMQNAGFNQQATGNFAVAPDQTYTPAATTSTAFSPEQPFGVVGDLADLNLANIDLADIELADLDLADLNLPHGALDYEGLGAAAGGDAQLWELDDGFDELIRESMGIPSANNA